MSLLILTLSHFLHLLATVVWIGGIMMILRHFLVALMIIVHFYRGLILNPRIGRLSSQISETQVFSSLSSQVARLQSFSLSLVKTNLVLGMMVLLLTGISLSLWLDIRFNEILTKIENFPK